VVLRKPGRGKTWEILMDDKPMARFSQLEEAVAAVDYEVEQRGPAAAVSALPSAAWRLQEATQSSYPKSRQLALWDRIIRST